MGKQSHNERAFGLREPYGGMEEVEIVLSAQDSRVLRNKMVELFSSEDRAGDFRTKPSFGDSR